MVLHILRAMFILLMGAVGWSYVMDPSSSGPARMAVLVTLCIAIFFICVDVLSPRKKLSILSGTFFGLLVGMITAYALSYVVLFMVDLFGPKLAPAILGKEDTRKALVNFLYLVEGIVCCYLAISLVLQTKDDFRFIIPYVEFSKQIRGARPIVVDTSVIIDGRILDIADTGILESRLIIPRFVVQELQMLADNGDKLKRTRGKRGLDILTRLQENKKLEVILYEWTGHNSPEAEGTDQKLLALAKEVHARVLTNDSNLAKVAQVRGVDVINVNLVANALRPVVLPGERMIVRLAKPGEEPTQGVGFLEDGTMVVVKDGRNHINEEVEFVVTNVLQTSTGRMVFGQLGDGSALGQKRPRPRPGTIQTEQAQQ